LVPLYAAGLAAKDGLRAAGVLKVKKLGWPVVSVGSLSAGGAGKTPVVIALADLLREHGWQVDVLSRGYGRVGNGVERVDPEAADAAVRFGDEPVLIAQRTGVPVWVGAERFAAGQAAESLAAETQNTGVLHSVQNDNSKTGISGNGRRLHLLDDGFQHRGLARAADIVLVTEQDLDDSLLPAGNRREPLAALRRADVVVLREEERERVEPRVRGWMRLDAAIWTVRRAIDIPGELPGAGKLTRENYALLAFCAIARPQNFVDTLRTGGVRVADSIAFPDHHRYTAEDMRQLIQGLQTRAADGFITTEKDAVKLMPQLRAQLEAAAPLLIARLQTTFGDPHVVLRELEARLQ
jgi:tetraacyldisaccharide 4'-kinase